MKLAIIGSSPIALEAALRFHEHEAALTWFLTGSCFYEGQFTSPELDPLALTSETGLRILKTLEKTYAPKVFSYEEWKTHYFEPLRNMLASTQVVKAHEPVSITKRFLAPDEKGTKSRFFDLFRIIFTVDPKTFIESQKETDPEMYKKLSEEHVGSLKSSIEMFEDFDLVMDLREGTTSSSLAPTGRALGEKRANPEKVISGLSTLNEAKNWSANDSKRELALIGSGALAAEVLIHFKNWLSDPRNRMFLITTEEEPFATFLKDANSETKKSLEKVFTEVEVRLQQDFDEFHGKLREWQELDDFVKVKKPRPAEPIPQLNFFSGHNLTAIDELIDKNRLFVTIEKPEFRNGKKHPENNLVDLKTLGVDGILGTLNLESSEIKTGLENDETGFFEIKGSLPNQKEYWEKDLKRLKEIEDAIFNLFSPAQPH
jgi:hypothetical protein